MSTIHIGENETRRLEDMATRWLSELKAMEDDVTLPALNDTGRLRVALQCLLKVTGEIDTEFAINGVARAVASLIISQRNPADVLVAFNDRVFNEIIRMTKPAGSA